MSQKYCFPVILFALISLCVASPVPEMCLDTGNFIPNSTYDKNRGLILSALAANVSAQGGFYNASIGQGPDQVYAMGVCIPGNPADVCSYCIQRASNGLKQNCPNQTEAFHWPAPFDITLCLVRYSDRSFLGSLELEPHLWLPNVNDLTTNNQTEFDEIWKGLMHRLIDAASSGVSSSKLKYFATGIAPWDFQNIYAYMQCTPDLSPGDCKACLRESVGNFQLCCRGRRGGTIRRPNCVFRWDLYPFFGVFDDITLAPPPQPRSQLLPTPTPSPGNQGNAASKDSKTLSTGTLVAIVALTVITMSVLLALGCFLYWRKRSYQATKSEVSPLSLLKFDLSIIQAATDDFSKESKLGEGGFGPVYKGKLPSGQEIAVKRLSKHSEQGEHEFKNEVMLLSGLQHRNLVKLLGFCLKGDDRLLIYEFLPNSSLDRLIFDSFKRSLATWNIRYNIIGGIARGLLYLHEDSRLRIIHRDLKPGNILLENSMNPKISDFGMARLFTADETHANTSRVMGTHGYMAPEYIKQGLFSARSDVYSFGIMVLEIICGRKNNSFQPSGLPGYVWMRWREGRGLDIVDPVIRNGSESEIVRCIHIGLLCVQENVTKRPAMNSVVLWLNRGSTNLPVPTTPAFFMHNTSEPETSSSFQSEPGSKKNRQFSLNEASITEFGPR